METGLVKVPVTMVDRDPSQPRRDFDETSLHELAKSIEANGLLQPIALRINGDGRYKLIAGERRFRAMQLLGWTEVPAIVHDVSDTGFRKFQLLENMVRKDLNAIEAATAIKQMLDEGTPASEIGQSIGKDTGYVTWLTQLLKCTDQVQHLIAIGQVKPWVGWHLSRLSPNGQARALRTFQLHPFSAKEEVALCERIYAEEHNIPLFDMASLTSAEIKQVQVFEKAFTRLLLEFRRVEKLEKVKPGSAAAMKIPRQAVIELEAGLRRLNKLILRNETAKGEDDGQDEKAGSIGLP